MRWGFTSTQEEKHSEDKMKTYQQTDQLRNDKTVATAEN